MKLTIEKQTSVCFFLLISKLFSRYCECQFKDVHEKEWNVFEKRAIASKETPSLNSSNPQPGVIRCKLIAEYENSALVTTEEPWGIESVEGQSKFEVSKTMLVEWD